MTMRHLLKDFIAIESSEQLEDFFELEEIDTDGNDENYHADFEDEEEENEDDIGDGGDSSQLGLPKVQSDCNSNPHNLVEQSITSTLQEIEEDFREHHMSQQNLPSNHQQIQFGSIGESDIVCRDDILTVIPTFDKESFGGNQSTSISKVFFSLRYSPVFTQIRKSRTLNNYKLKFKQLPEDNCIQIQRNKRFALDLAKTGVEGSNDYKNEFGLVGLASLQHQRLFERIHTMDIQEKTHFDQSLILKDNLDLVSFKKSVTGEETNNGHDIKDNKYRLSFARSKVGVFQVEDW